MMSTDGICPNSVIAELETVDGWRETHSPDVIGQRTPQRTGDYASFVLMASGLVFQATYAVYPKI